MKLIKVCFQNETERVLIFILLVFFVLGLNGCIISSYGPNPNEIKLENHSMQKMEPLYFFYQPYVLDPDASHKKNQKRLRLQMYSLVKAFEEKSGFSKLELASTPPERGWHVTVHHIEKHLHFTSGLQTFISSLCFITLTAIPCYFDEEYLVQYEINKDRLVKKTYDYSIEGTSVFGIGLIPFVWVEFFTTSRNDALKATAYQFIRDGQNDGLF